MVTKPINAYTIHKPTEKFSLLLDNEGSSVNGDQYFSFDNVMAGTTASKHSHQSHAMLKNHVLGVP
jgi:hypothetical protein